MDTVLANSNARAESFEATLRMLDEHPTYVDEFFEIALRHPATFERILENHAIALADDDLARRTAAHLSAHPAGLYQIMVKTLDAIAGRQLSMAAVSKAMAERPQVAAMVITQRRDAVQATLTALVKEARKNEKAREAFLNGVEQNSDALARMLVANPGVLGQLVKALGGAGVSKGKAELAALGKALDTSD